MTKSGAKSEVAEVSKKVLVVTSIGHGKGYAKDFLFRVLDGLVENPEDALIIYDGVKIDENLPYRALETDTPTSTPRTERLAIVREMARKYFLSERGKGFTHIYFHDGDMIPDKNIINSLLQQNAEYLLSGIYPVRTVLDPIVPMLEEGTPEDNAIPLQNTSLIKTRGQFYTCKGFGQGCMLLSRSVLENVGYRKSDFYADEHIGEDYQFCMDVKEELGLSTILDLSQTPFHCDDAGANRLVIGDLAEGLVYHGNQNTISNRYGHWYLNVPRFDLDQETMKLIDESPEISIQKVRKVEIERMTVEEAMVTMGYEDSK